MSKIQKLISRLVSNPADFTWKELSKVLGHFGYEELKTGKTSGARRKFANEEKHIISLHKPHPGSIVNKSTIKDVVETLKERGKIKDE